MIIDPERLLALGWELTPGRLLLPPEGDYRRLWNHEPRLEAGEYFLPHWTGDGWNVP